MTNTGKEIARLMRDTGKSAPEITHALSELGGGSMQKGLARIAQYFTEEAAQNASRELSHGRIQGGIAGVLTTAAVGAFLYAVSKKKEKDTAHETEGQTILKAMKSDGSSNASADDSSAQNDKLPSEANLADKTGV